MTTNIGQTLTPSGSTEPAKGHALRDSFAPILAFLIILAFGVFIWYLMRNLDLSETEWARAIFLFAGVEAVAFAAAGYFFGTQVQRGRLEEARADVEVATQVATRAVEVAEAERSNCSMLAEGIVAAVPSSENLAGTGDGTGSSAIGLVLAQARALLREKAHR